MIEDEAETLIETLVADPAARVMRRDECRVLAERLRQSAIDLCMSRATEHSPRIGGLFLHAAKVAALGYLPDEEIPGRYLHDIRNDGDAKAELERFLTTIA